MEIVEDNQEMINNEDAKELQEIEKNDSQKKKTPILFKLLITIVALFICYFIFLMFYFPIKQVKEFNITYADSTLYSEDEKVILLDDNFSSLKIKEAFLQSRLSMAKSDSICFSIDLVDSLLMLEVKGVVIHEAKITKIDISRFFSRVDNEALIKFLSESFIIGSKNATIEKEPYILKKAPKDTIEAATQIFTPDTLAQEIICMTMLFNKNLLLEINQSEEKPEHKNISYNIKTKVQSFKYIINRVFDYKSPTYIPKISIELPKRDIKSIYRAIPYHSQMALHL